MQVPELGISIRFLSEAPFLRHLALGHNLCASACWQDNPLQYARALQLPTNVILI